ncbi:MAG: hypothetical protein KDF65_09540 [Anaerolineae bacterium]|nr:hypothetical protein [Anaerolineae bacterium]
MAWSEGRSRKHETDIYEMLVFHYLGLDPSISIDEQLIDAESPDLGHDVMAFWAAVKKAARVEAERLAGQE